MPEREKHFPFVRRKADLFKCVFLFAEECEIQKTVSGEAKLIHASYRRSGATKKSEAIFQKKWVGWGKGGTTITPLYVPSSDFFKKAGNPL